ncbi:helix-turn-helix domain-containing protein [Arthrobacter sp. YAF17]|uniref:helix-turn-helix domain-containing protein n=1 Tax=Arthrobacter sp. YAF17 TaxID=3233077 RepID=UPI003F8DF463
MWRPPNPWTYTSVNTVRYRLSRVEPLFGIDLDYPATRLLVLLQLWARRQLALASY